jgi:hypothetical protein
MSKSSTYTDGKLVVDAIRAWAVATNQSIVDACDRMGVTTTSFYNWANGQMVQQRTLAKIESTIGKVVVPVPRKMPEYETVEVHADKWAQLVDCLMDAHARRESHVDMAIAVSCAKGCMDAILDLQEKEMEARS